MQNKSNLITTQIAMIDTHAPSPESFLYWFKSGTLENPPTSRKEKGM